MSKLKRVLYIGGIVLGVIYLLNPGAGVFELIPDNLPIIGNLDEAAAFALILACYRKLKARAEPQPAALPTSPSDKP